MRIILAFLVLAACSKPNPGICSEDDPCDEGLVCRGNQCIAVACQSSTECDASAPYCITELERCQELCTADSQCPGFGQSASQVFCEGGVCVACRDATECSLTAPVCSDGVCTACAANEQ